jgi:hypothetical protein
VISKGVPFEIKVTIALFLCPNTMYKLGHTDKIHGGTIVSVAHRFHFKILLKTWRLMTRKTHLPLVAIFG